VIPLNAVYNLNFLFQRAPYWNCDSSPMENPYSSPTTTSKFADDIAVQLEQNTSLTTLARRIFLAWERLRILYIALLALLTLVLAGTQIFEPEMLALVVGGAIVSNVCYFAGPIVETYITWLGYDGKRIRWLLFAGGTLMTAMVAYMSIATTLAAN